MLTRLDRLQAHSLGIALGLLIAVVSHRKFPSADHVVDYLGDGAMLLLLASVALSIWLSRDRGKSTSQ